MYISHAACLWQCLWSKIFPLMEFATCDLQSSLLYIAVSSSAVDRSRSGVLQAPRQKPVNPAAEDVSTAVYIP